MMPFSASAAPKRGEATRPSRTAPQTDVQKAELTDQRSALLPTFSKLTVSLQLGEVDSDVCQKRRGAPSE